MVPKPEGTAAYPDKASSSGDKTTGTVPSATTTSVVQITVDLSRDKSKQQHEKRKGASSSMEVKAGRRKTEKNVEESHLSTEKHLVLAPKQKTPDLNLPS